MSGRIQFAEFEADIAAGELRRAGTLVPIQDLPFRLLAALLEKPGELVTRAELTSRLWGSDTYVDATAGLNTAVGKLREALGDDAERPTFIDTVPRRGYRFIGRIEPVTRVAEGPSPWRVVAPLPNGELAKPPSWNRYAMLTALLAGSIGAVLTSQLIRDRATSATTSSDGRVRIAVVLFDNETGRPELARLAQNLTDATVTELTAETRLAVIGNAAVLRTERPFRDVAKVRDELQADYIVVGQLQTRDGETIVRGHLIRGSDQAHVWSDVARMTADEAALQSDITGQIRAAVASRVLAAR